MSEDVLGDLPDRLCDRKERRQVSPYSDSHWDRLEADGQVPARVVLGPGRVAWWLSELLAHAKALPRRRPGGKAA